VQTIQARGDGWLEITLLAPHSGNSLHNMLIEDVDGDLDDVNRRLAQLGLLRDALVRVLPVEIECRDDERRGMLVEDVTVHPRPAIEGYGPTRRVEGTVIYVGIVELGPLSGGSPYRDASDVANVVLLRMDGGIEQAVIDLQRPDLLTGHAMLEMAQQALRTRRPVALRIANVFQKDPRSDAAGQVPRNDVAQGRRGGEGAMMVVGCEWLVVSEATLDTEYAFVERLGQRYESYVEDDARALSYVEVTYTTAPGQTPEGDVSDDGSFAPVTRIAWVHGDSPLLQRLEAVLRDRLQVRIGRLEDAIHEVVVVGKLGSAARPIWIKVRRQTMCDPCDAPKCENVPTIRGPEATTLDSLPRSVVWRGDGYFNEGIWRFVIRAQSPTRLWIDGRTPCREEEDGEEQCCPADDHGHEAEDGQHHVYLSGVHEVKLLLTGRSCNEPFQLLVYRIR
ncbi:MAG: hypothetical protein ABIW83_09615, partial [Allosphingosinicella sp.]